MRSLSTRERSICSPRDVCGHLWDRREGWLRFLGLERDGQRPGAIALLHVGEDGVETGGCNTAVGERVLRVVDLGEVDAVRQLERLADLVAGLRGREWRRAALPRTEERRVGEEWSVSGARV